MASKFEVFERSGGEPRRAAAAASDRYGIMEKLRRLQEGADLDELLAEMDEELPSEDDGEDEDGEDLTGLTEVQKKTLQAERLLLRDEGSAASRDRKQQLAEERRKEIQRMRQTLTSNTGGDPFDDLLNASANKVKKTKARLTPLISSFAH